MSNEDKDAISDILHKCNIQITNELNQSVCTAAIDAISENILTLREMCPRYIVSWLTKHFPYVRGQSIDMWLSAAQKTLEAAREREELRSYGYTECTPHTLLLLVRKSDRLLKLLDDRDAEIRVMHNRVRRYRRKLFSAKSHINKLSKSRA